MELEIIIKPLKGVVFRGYDINFGMSQQDVEKELGKPVKVEINNLINQAFEPRNGTVFRYKNDKLYSVEVPIGKGNRVLYENIDILNDKDAVAKLSEYDTPTPDNGKYMNFYKLGICLGGYGKKRIPEKKMVIAFSEEQEILFKMRFLSCGGKL